MIKIEHLSWTNLPLFAALPKVVCQLRVACFLLPNGLLLLLQRSPKRHTRRCLFLFSMKPGGRFVRSICPIQSRGSKFPYFVLFWGKDPPGEAKTPSFHCFLRVSHHICRRRKRNLPSSGKCNVQPIVAMARKLHFLRTKFLPSGQRFCPTLAAFCVASNHLKCKGCCAPFRKNNSTLPVNFPIPAVRSGCCFWDVCF